jgi:methionyl-tRNA formyltransferase
VRIAFFGLPMAALVLLRDGHELVVAALSRPGLPGTRRLRRALGPRVLVKPSVDGRFATRIAGADLVVSWFWTKKLPLAVVRAAPLGGFGVHPSLLPRWRGPDPYFWAIDAGDRVTGVTAHRLDAEYDTGAMLGAREVTIHPDWDSWRLARALDRPSLVLLRETVARFAAGAPPPEVEQDEALVTEAPEPGDELLEIDWQRDAEAIVRRIRAAAPYPGAWTFIGEEAVVVTRAAVADAPRVLAPGEASLVGGRPVVAAKQGAVALLSGRLVADDGEERPLDETALVDLVRAARIERD